jgi:predicted enzyme related to lactoylglutathione lyase
MTSGFHTVIYPVDDLAAAKSLYSTLLGTEPSTDAPYYVGFTVAGQDIGLDPNGHRQGVPGPVVYWEVDDIEASLTRLLGAGAQEQQPVKDVGGGKLVATVTDADGNGIGLMQTP